MPFFLNPRFAMLLMVGLPVMGGASIHPQGAGAFIMGAWAGVLIAGPPLMITAWILGVINMRQLLAPLVRLPVLIGLSVVLLYFSGADLGIGLQALGAAGLLWWARRGRHFLSLS